MVEKEFATLEGDATVYKLIGPVLVKQNISESQANVTKRLGYIKDELSRADQVILDLEAELEKKKNQLTDLAKKAQQEKAATSQEEE